MTTRRQEQSSARAVVLGNVRAALDGAERSGAQSVPRNYARGRPSSDPSGLFAERVADYEATVQVVTRSEIGTFVRSALEGSSAHRVLTPEGLPGSWFDDGAGITTVNDSEIDGVAELDDVDAVVTTATVGIATTGTIVLDHGPGQGRRALTLVPDVHVCVVEEDHIVDDVPAALAKLDPRGPLTFISGPSATSDIELDRVAGVHGPRTLHVLVVRQPQ